jgi:uncharacterized protein DUF4279
MRKEISASFQIASESLSGAELRAQTGLTTGVIHNRGEPISSRPGSHDYKQSVLRIESSLSTGNSVGEHLAQLISVLEPHAANIAGILAECTCEIWFKIAHDKSQLGFEIPTRSLTALAPLGVVILFDIYSETAGEASPLVWTDFSVG